MQCTQLHKCLKFTRLHSFAYRLRRDRKSSKIVAFSYQRSPLEVYSLALGTDGQLRHAQGEASTGEIEQLSFNIQGSLRDTLQSLLTADSTEVTLTGGAVPAADGAVTTRVESSTKH